MGSVKLDGEEAVFCQAKPTPTPLFQMDFLKSLCFLNGEKKLISRVD